MTCVVDGPQLASTPVKTRQATSSPCLQFSPHKINYSESISCSGDSTTAAGAGVKSSRVSNGSDENDGCDEISLIGELVQGRKEDAPGVMNPNSTLDQLEDALCMWYLYLGIYKSYFQLLSVCQ